MQSRSTGSLISIIVVLGFFFIISAGALGAYIGFQTPSPYKPPTAPPRATLTPLPNQQRYQQYINSLTAFRSRLTTLGLLIPQACKTNSDEISIDQCKRTIDQIDFFADRLIELRAPVPYVKTQERAVDAAKSYKSLVVFVRQTVIDGNGTKEAGQQVMTTTQELTAALNGIDIELTLVAGATPLP